MTAQHLIAPADLIDDLNKLDATLTDDVSGERARAMVAYFDMAIKACGTMIERAGSEAERQLLRTMYEGFQASRRIVEQVWQSFHRTPLGV